MPSRSTQTSKSSGLRPTWTSESSRWRPSGGCTPGHPGGSPSGHLMALDYLVHLDLPDIRIHLTSFVPHGGCVLDHSLLQQISLFCRQLAHSYRWRCSKIKWHSLHALMPLRPWLSQQSKGIYHIFPDYPFLLVPRKRIFESVERLEAACLQSGRDCHNKALG